MRLMKRRVKGSSIMEIVTGLFIVTLSMALTGVLFANVLDASGRMRKQQAWYAIQEWGNQTRMNKNLEPQEISRPSFRMIKNCILLEEEKRLWEVIIVAVEEKAQAEPKELAVIRFLMEVDEERQKE